MHAIQLEFNRGLYMNERTMQRGRSMAAIRDVLESTVKAIAEATLTIALPANAAE
jgi:N-formylglutamate amidohydrolase